MTETLKQELMPGLRSRFFTPTEMFHRMSRVRSGKSADHVC